MHSPLPKRALSKLSTSRAFHNREWGHGFKLSLSLCSSPCWVGSEVKPLVQDVQLHNPCLSGPRASPACPVPAKLSQIHLQPPALELRWQFSHPGLSNSAFSKRQMFPQSPRPCSSSRSVFHLLAFVAPAARSHSLSPPGYTRPSFGAPDHVSLLSQICPWPPLLSAT